MITAVAMSGGVDSSTAAWLLLNDPELKSLYPDNRIIAVTHWWDELEQSSPGLQRRAEAVCERLGIPYHVIELGGLFRREVMDYFAGSYTAGRTPNPCVFCNGRIRFSEFYRRCRELAAAEYGESAGPGDFRFVTGHYVRLAQKDGRTFLRKAADPVKDQSYMLYRIPSDVLESCIFPLGSYTKDRIKKIADENGFFGKAIKESQDICFIDDDYVSFLKRYLPPLELEKFDHPGFIYDTNGVRLGRSRGFLHYTVGQRKGLGLGNGPWYVKSVEPDSNRVTVGRKNQLGSAMLRAGDLNWFIEPPGQAFECTVQLRYNSTEYRCRVTPAASGRTGRCVDIELEKPAVWSPGQSAVFYDGELVIGGGVILRPDDE